MFKMLRIVFRCLSLLFLFVNDFKLFSVLIVLRFMLSFFFKFSCFIVVVVDGLLKFMGVLCV